MGSLKQTTYFSDEYHACAGCVLFRFTPRPQICILQNRRSMKFILPKGHRELGETLEQAALRETYEETGWRCEFLPINLLTSVPPPGTSSRDRPKEARAVKGEPIAVTMRHMNDRDKHAKFIWWFVAQITGLEREEGTQMANESFDVEFVDADEAVGKLSRVGDKDVASRAIKLVRDTRIGDGISWATRTELPTGLWMGGADSSRDDSGFPNFATPC